MRDRAEAKANGMAGKGEVQEIRGRGGGRRGMGRGSQREGPRWQRGLETWLLANGEGAKELVKRLMAMEWGFEEG